MEFTSRSSIGTSAKRNLADSHGQSIFLRDTNSPLAKQSHNSTLPLSPSNIDEIQINSIPVNSQKQNDLQADLVKQCEMQNEEIKVTRNLLAVAISNYENVLQEVGQIRNSYQNTNTDIPNESSVLNSSEHQRLLQSEAFVVKQHDLQNEQKATLDEVYREYKNLLHSRQHEGADHITKLQRELEATTAHNTTLQQNCQELKSANNELQAKQDILLTEMNELQQKQDKSESDNCELSYKFEILNCNNLELKQKQNDLEIKQNKEIEANFIEIENQERNVTATPRNSIVNEEEKTKLEIIADARDNKILHDALDRLEAYVNDNQRAQGQGDCVAEKQHNIMMKEKQFKDMLQNLKNKI